MSAESPESIDSTVSTEDAVESSAGRRLRSLQRTTPWVLIVGGAIGLLAAVQLVVDKIGILSDPNFTPSCNINPVLSCGTIIITDQASVFGFPNPLMGIAGFAIVVFFGVLLVSKVLVPRWIWIGLNIGAALGMAFVIWLFVQSLYVIGALCPWCMVVWTITIPIFWFVTIDNIGSGRIRIGTGLAEALVQLRYLLVGATYLVAILLIFLRWDDFWLGRT